MKSRMTTAKLGRDTVAMLRDVVARGPYSPAATLDQAVWFLADRLRQFFDARSVEWGRSHGVDGIPPNASDRYGIPSGRASYKRRKRNP